MSNAKVLGAVLLSSIVWGCAYTPIPFEDNEPKGPGLFSGASGSFVLIGEEEKGDKQDQQSGATQNDTFKSQAQDEK